MRFRVVVTVLKVAALPLTVTVYMPAGVPLLPPDPLLFWTQAARKRQPTSAKKVRK